MIQGVKLKQRREAVGLTQQELADQLCVTVQAVSQWENGRTQPDSDRILLLAKLLKTTADALLDEAQTGVAPWQLTDQMFSEEHMYSKAYLQTRRTSSPAWTSPEPVSSTHEKSSVLLTAMMTVAGCPAALIFSKSIVSSKSPFFTF